MDDDFQRFEMMRNMFVDDKDIRLKMLLKGYKNTEIDAFFRGEKLAPKVVIGGPSLPNLNLPQPQGESLTSYNADSTSGMQSDESTTQLQPTVPHTPSVNNAIPLNSGRQNMERYVLMRNMSVPESKIKEKMISNGVSLEEITKFFQEYPSLAGDTLLTGASEKIRSDSSATAAPTATSSIEGIDVSDSPPELLLEPPNLDFSGFLKILKGNLSEELIRQKMEIVGFSNVEIETILGDQTVYRTHASGNRQQGESAAQSGNQNQSQSASLPENGSKQLTLSALSHHSALTNPSGSQSSSNKIPSFKRPMSVGASTSDLNSSVNAVISVTSTSLTAVDPSVALRTPPTFFKARPASQATTPTSDRDKSSTAASSEKTDGSVSPRSGAVSAKYDPVSYGGINGSVKSVNSDHNREHLKLAQLSTLGHMCVKPSSPRRNSHRIQSLPNHSSAISISPRNGNYYGNEPPSLARNPVDGTTTHLVGGPDSNCVDSDLYDQYPSTEDDEADTPVNNTKSISKFNTSSTGNHSFPSESSQDHSSIYDEANSTLTSSATKRASTSTPRRSSTFSSILSLFGFHRGSSSTTSSKRESVHHTDHW